MFKEKDGEDLRNELGLTPERAEELLNIIQTIIDQEAPDGGSGRTSHVLLNISGRKDLTEVERVACTFLFCCKMFMNKTKASRPSRCSNSPCGEKELPRIIPKILSSMPPGMPNLKEERFLDIEGGIAGMIVAPEGVDKSELAGVMMISITSLLRGMSKKDAQEFCRNASIAFARMALTGDIKL